MKGRMTVTLNANEDVCAVQKAGEVGIGASVIIQCLRIAAVKAVEITGKLETAVIALSLIISNNLNFSCSIITIVGFY